MKTFSTSNKTVKYVGSTNVFVLWYFSWTLFTLTLSQPSRLVGPSDHCLIICLLICTCQQKQRIHVFFVVYLFYVLILEIFAWNLVPSFNIFHSISNLIIDIQTSKFWSHTICIILGKFYRKISLKILTLKSRSIFHFIAIRIFIFHVRQAVETCFLVLFPK